MTAAPHRVVCVFGSGDPGRGDPGYEQARAVGRRLAELGYAVANGGYGGTMEASARGAVEAGGQTVGVTCAVWGARPNPYVRQVIETSDLAERVARLIEIGRSGYVVLPGATGTLVELAWAWEHLAKGMLPRRPLVCLGEFWEPIVQRIATARPSTGAVVGLAKSVDGLAEWFPPAHVP